jgi:hypothetical protein
MPEYKFLITSSDSISKTSSSSGARSATMLLTKCLRHSLSTIRSSKPSSTDICALEPIRYRVGTCASPNKIERIDGKSLSTPEGVDIWRRGNVYIITDPSGDSVSAVVNPTWIDVSVGLGHWPAKVSGLLANADGNVNKIAARDGTVLTNPFSFEDLYQRYSESWRVASGESLLSVCGERNVERGNPRSPFFAKDLDPQVYERTRAVCTAAGVKAGLLLDACTLDVAVIGDDAAAKVFVGAPAPIVIGTMVTTSGERGPGFIVWLLLIVVLVVIAFILWMLRRRKTQTTP